MRCILFVGYLLMLGLTVETTRLQVTWRMIILGIGLGPALPLYTLAVQNSVNPHEIGAATSSSQFFRQVGPPLWSAVFGTILATALAGQLPKYMPAEMQKTKVSGISLNMGQLESGNFIAVGDQIKAGMKDTYARIEQAMIQNDPGAVQSVIADTGVPPEVKDMLQKGGVAAQVKAGQDAQYQRIAAALTRENRTALKGPDG